MFFNVLCCYCKTHLCQFSLKFRHISLNNRLYIGHIFFVDFRATSQVSKSSNLYTNKVKEKKVNVGVSMLISGHHRTNDSLPELQVTFWPSTFGDPHQQMQRQLQPAITKLLIKYRFLGSNSNPLAREQAFYHLCNQYLPDEDWKEREINWKQRFETGILWLERITHKRT